jgi:hypothetical protein
MSGKLHHTGEPIPREWYVVKAFPGCRIGDAEFGQDVLSSIEGGILVVKALAPVSRDNPPLRIEGWVNCMIEPTMPIRIIDFDGTVLAFAPFVSARSAS